MAVTPRNPAGFPRGRFSYPAGFLRVAVSLEKMWVLLVNPRRALLKKILGKWTQGIRQPYIFRGKKRRVRGLVGLISFKFRITLYKPKTHFTWENKRKLGPGGRCDAHFPWKTLGVGARLVTWPKSLQTKTHFMSNTTIFPRSLKVVYILKGTEIGVGIAIIKGSLIANFPSTEI